jgi:P4 family phage/plasmid primase-like protien
MVPTTISTIMADPSRYDGLLCLDPIEPDYDGHKVVGKIFFRGDKSFVSSFAHGGRKFPFGGSDTFSLHIDRKNHMGTADAIIDLLTDGSEFGFLTLAGEFFKYTGTNYEAVTSGENAVFTRTYLSHATCDDKDGNPTPVNPDNAYVANIDEALKARSFVKVPKKDPPPPPYMLEAQPVCHGLGRVYVPKADVRGMIEQGRYVALRNGLFDLKTDSLIPHNIAYFDTNVADFDYDENATCPLFWKTVNDWFDGDKETVDLYFRMLGYLISSENSAQKIFGLYGPPRSGKGVTQSIIEALVGRSGIFSTKLKALTTEHGLQGSIYKKVMLFADVKDSFTGSDGIAEALLKISSGDLDSISRKYLPVYEGRHTARVVMCGNAPPRLTEGSNALFSRFVIMTFTKSYLGQENENLTDQLRAELPGIFNRALVGLREWQAGAKFESPRTSAEHVRQARDGISSIPGFLEECCEVGKGFCIDKEILYEKYVSFAGLGGSHSKSKNVFFRDLYSHDMRFKSTRVRTNGHNSHVIECLKLADYDSEITLANGQTFVKNSGPDSTVVTGKTILKGE